MYCETETELAIFNKLRFAYPNKNEYLMDLMAWVFINQPEKFCAIMEAHQAKADANAMMDLADFDVSTVLKNRG